jgi:hypothetical protein
MKNFDPMDYLKKNLKIDLTGLNIYMDDKKVGKVNSNQFNMGIAVLSTDKLESDQTLYVDHPEEGRLQL